jgi:hypothetical protein
MSMLKRNRFRKKLKKLLSKAFDEQFIQMIWAVNALQSDRIGAASKYLTFPKEAATSAIDSKFAIHKWELETLVSQLLTIPKNFKPETRSRIANCQLWGTCSAAMNFLRGLENEEAEIYLKDKNILDELPRIGHREFAWQRGFANWPQLYRYAFIYGQGKCADYFKNAYGLSINEFSLCGVGLYSAFLAAPLLQNFHMRDIEVADEAFRAALKLLSLPIERARNGAVTTIQTINQKYHGSLPTAYQPSFIRQYPVITFGDMQLRSPIPDLILLRTTSGLFYDLIKGGTDLRNEAAERFETYSAEFLSRTLPRFEILRSEKYKNGTNLVDAPDIRVRDGEMIKVAIECKATRLSFDAQFADNPLAEARVSYDEIAKSIFQLWRYFSHTRRRLIDANAIDSNAYGVVLTLDSWMLMSQTAPKQVLAKAEELAAKDPQILPEDRRKISFTNIQDLENLLLTGDEDSFLAVLAAALEERFAGWFLPDIRREIRKTKGETKPFPFEAKAVLPWWHRIQELDAQRRGPKAETN